jgi:3-oxoacyl-[acyl-carrier protein] reductase
VDLGLAEATAVVTGGSKGMGLAIGQCLGEEGARVALLARGPDSLRDAAERVAASGSPEVIALPTDVTDPTQVRQAFETIGDRWGMLNVLVNTVGPGAGSFESLTDADWRRAFDLGAMTAVRCIRAALPLLRAATWARIVNLAAHSVKRQSPMLVAYTAAKSALASLSKNLARSLAPEGILVNTVSPGTIVTASFTEGLRPALEARGLDPTDPVHVMRFIEDEFHHKADLGRAGLPEEVAAVVVFLASPRNGYVTGANLNVDGGSDFC